ncbi:MAG: DUF3592 domain-containing protein [Endomicrobium sp.]|jgi:hypothetical protein|nr:DUF3592 domain-containing protein [Endomicrobium sp.]
MFSIFLFAGLLIMLFGFGLVRNNYEFFRTSLKAAGTITDITIERRGHDDKSYRVVAAYNVDGQDYKSIVKFYHSGMRVGDDITMYYNPYNPADARTMSGDIIGSGLVSLFGLIFSLVGFVPLVRNIRRRRELITLFKTGIKREVAISHIYQYDGYKVNRKSPYIIRADLSDSGRTISFSSEYLWFNPEFYAKPGDIIYVYISAENPDKYFLDVTPIYLKSKQKLPPRL